MATIWNSVCAAVEPLSECISHTVFETCNMKKALTFYSEVLGTGVPIACGEEMLIPTQNGQMIGLVEVAELSERSKKHGRGCHMAMDVPQEDFDSMVALVERYGGKTKATNAPKTAYDRKASAAFISSTPITIACKSPPTRRIKKKNCSTTKKNGAASSPAATSKAKGFSRWESGGKN